ncbi:MAG: WecB/TagA/CpsF family glycosyltransferase [Elusimicrobia bacterium]|nr:WecB/TagA/CpsF family glycosyltransferase [Elusimicrobiota bacterium]
MQVTTLSKENIIKKCNELIAAGRQFTVVTLNSIMLRYTWRNRELYKALNNAGLITADSVGICVASLLLDRKIVFRYPGIDMIEDLIEQGWSFYLLGGREGIASGAGRNLSQKHGSSVFLGAHNGYFSESEEENVIAEINSLSPDILFVGMDTPRQEIWIDHKREKISTRLIMGVGGSFDVFCGRLNRAPAGFRFFGVEWAWRMLLQPWRVHRLVHLTQYIMDMLWRFFRAEGVFSKTH